MSQLNLHKYLVGHPGQDWCNKLFSDSCKGVDIGFDHVMKCTVLENWEWAVVYSVVSDYLTTEVALGRKVGLFIQ